MDGRRFQSGRCMRAGETPYQFQSERGLEMHAGELLDAAEGRGHAVFTVVRPPTGVKEPAGVDPSWRIALEERHRGRE